MAEAYCGKIQITHPAPIGKVSGEYLKNTGILNVD